MRKSWIFFFLFILFGSAAARSPIPVLVLPFENSTPESSLDHFSSWLKMELKTDPHLKLIEFYKTTNINGILILYLKPSPLDPGNEKIVSPAAYFVVSGTIRCTGRRGEQRTFIHVDVVNSATDWVIAKDDVYADGPGTGEIRKNLVSVLARRLSLKLMWKDVGPYSDKKNMLFGPGMVSDATNGSSTPAVPSSSGGDNHPFNEKKEVRIVVENSENTTPEKSQSLSNSIRRGFLQPERYDPDKRPGNEIDKNRIAFEPVFSANFKPVSNTVFLNYELSYRFEILPKFYIGLQAGYGSFHCAGSDINYQINQFRLMPLAIFRWPVFLPLYLDFGAGIGGYTGNISLSSVAVNYDRGLSGLIFQGKAGIGLKLGFLFLTFYGILEGDQVNYQDQTDNFFVTMTAIGFSVEFGF